MRQVKWTQLSKPNTRALELLLAVVLLGSFACSRSSAPRLLVAEAAVKSKEKIVIDLGWEEYGSFQRGFDPTQGWSWNSYSDPLFHSRLFRRDTEQGLINDLAESFHLSQNRKIWTVKIRQDVRFSDGQRLTAADVAYTFNTYRPEIDRYSLNRAIATGDYEVQFHLKQPDITFVDRMASIGIVPKHAHNGNYARNPVGSGPYKLVQWNEGEQLVVEANPTYYGQSPKIKRVVFLFTQGDAAFAAARGGYTQVAKIPQALADRTVPGMQLYQIKSFDHTTLLFPFIPDTGKRNLQGYAIGNDILADRAIRQAINYAIDRRVLVKAILWGYGSPAYGFPSGPPLQTPAPAIQDANRDRVQQILAEAGWRDTNGNGTIDKQGKEAEFNLLYFSRLPEQQGFALAIAQMLKPFGINVSPEGSSWEKMKYRTHRDAWLYPLVTRPQDLYSLYRSPAGLADGRLNYSAYANPIVDQRLEQAMSAASEPEASQFWQQAQWDGKTGIGVKGDAASAWLVNYHDLYLVSQCLNLGRLAKPSNHYQGPLLSNIVNWEWTCN